MAAHRRTVPARWAGSGGKAGISRRFIALAAALITALASLVVLAAPASAAAGEFRDSSGIEYTYNVAAALVVGYSGTSRSVVIPDRVTPSGESTPVNVTMITPDAFSGKGLRSVVIGSKVKTIGNQAFRDNALQAVRIPASVNTVGVDAFAKNPPLSRVVFDGAAPRVTETGRGASFDISGGLTVSYWPGAKGFTSGTWQGYKSRSLSRGTCEPALFNDLSSGGFCPQITWLAGQGITDGYADGSFRPTDSITREAMAAFIYRSVNGTKSASSCLSRPFDDVSTSHPFCGEIQWMKTRGYTDGYSDGTFRPSDEITRQAMAAQLYRLKNSGRDASSCSSAPFNDVTTGHVFCGEISWMKANKITTGEDGSFNPQDPVSRQAMAAFLYRL